MYVRLLLLGALFAIYDSRSPLEIPKLNLSKVSNMAWGNVTFSNTNFLKPSFSRYHFLRQFKTGGRGEERCCLGSLQTLLHFTVS